LFGVRYFFIIKDFIRAEARAHMPYAFLPACLELYVLLAQKKDFDIGTWA
jgi:hypothetical protein